jgi:hypothetical protein
LHHAFDSDDLGIDPSMPAASGRKHRLAVNQHGASAALAQFTSCGAGQRHVFAQDFSKVLLISVATSRVSPVDPQAQERFG